MASTTIEWTDHSINPIRARLKSTGAVGHYCEKIAPGCTRCYSSRMQSRFNMPEFGSGQKRSDVELFLDESKLEEVRRRKKPTKYFWCDMTDIFGDWMQPEWLAAIFATIDATPQHTHQLLTKRPENIRRMWPRVGFPDAGVPGSLGRHLRLNNVWLGTSVSDQQSADKQIPELIKCRDLSPVLFLSVEPLLGPIDLGLSVATCECCDRWPSRWITLPRDVSGDFPIAHTSVAKAGTYRAQSNRHGALSVTAGDGKQLGIKPDEMQVHGPLDQVIIGGESGPGSRPCEVDWIRSLSGQCEAAGVPAFIKQLGAHVIDRGATVAHSVHESQCWPDGTRSNGQRILLTDKKGGDMDEWPADLRVRQFPKESE